MPSNDPNLKKLKKNQVSFEKIGNNISQISINDVNFLTGQAKEAIKQGISVEDKEECIKVIIKGLSDGSKFEIKTQINLIN